MASGTNEPWDADRYWTLAYPFALAFCAALGFFWRGNSWGVTGLFVFAQFPVMTMHVGISPMSLFGLAFVGPLSVPAMLAAWLASRLRMR